MASDTKDRPHHNLMFRVVRTAVFCLLTITTLSLAVAGWLLFSSYGLPPVDSLRAYSPVTSTAVPAMDCVEARIAGSVSEYQKLFPAMMAVEEVHLPNGKAKIVYADHIARMMLCDPHEKNLHRDLREIRLAGQIRLRFTEDEQRTIFLNLAFMGPGGRGAYTAATTYFDKKPSDLNIAQAALLVGLIKSPSAYSPTNFPDRALARRNQTLEAMLQQGLLSKDEAERAIASPLTTR
jgi:hypothetical protein